MAEKIENGTRVSEFDEKKKAPGSVGLIIVIVCAALVAGTLAYVLITKNSKQQQGGFPGGPGGRFGQQQTVISVRTQEAEVSTLNDYVITNGEIEAQSSIDVLPEMSGKVTDVYVMLGSHVNRGDLIAEVDPSQPGTKYAKSPVYAPISGTITKTPVKVGATVSTATVITVIGDIENLQVTASVPERYVSALKTGLKAEIVLEAYPSEKFSATVSRVSPVVDSTSRTKEVILTFDRRDSRVNAGMFAKVKLWTSKYSGCITIPSDAVVTNGDAKFVYVVNEDGNTVSRRSVTTGESVDNVIQITSGIEKGEKMVIEGMRTLSDGSKIQDITNGVQTVEDVPGIPDGDKAPEGMPGNAEGGRK